MENEQWNLIIRPALASDSTSIKNFLTENVKYHRHLDWRLPLDWLGHDPYFLGLSHERLNALLACPAEVAGVFWIRIFAAIDTLDPSDAWISIFPNILDYLKRNKSIEFIAALPYQAWFLETLINCGWKKTNEIVQLKANRNNSYQPSTQWVVRRMMPEDLDNVFKIDSLCFSPLWQHNRVGIGLAYRQAGYMSVITSSNQVIGYQISTTMHDHIHIARLGVDPQFRQQGVGVALVVDVMDFAKSSSCREVTVNTQADNHASIGLYQHCGFERTGEDFPVFQYFVD